MSWRLQGDARAVELTIYRVTGAGQMLVRQVTIARSAGSYSLASLRPGSYVVTLRASTDGRYSPGVQARFRALR